jgi:hypothetical protein
VNTKLTLRLDEDLIRAAKEHSARSGRSVSRLVADFFALIEAESPPRVTETTPRVRSLVGALSGATADESDHRRHLLEKHA